jgi:hypothetical protein
MRMYRLYGMIAAILLILGVAGFSAIDRAANWKPAKATVFLIERKCDIVETSTSFDGQKSSRTYNGDCKSVDDWTKAKEKHDKTISAKATVKVTYVAPQDGTSQTGELHFTSKDDEFYDLTAGEIVDVLVNNEDPTRIKKA